MLQEDQANQDFFKQYEFITLVENCREAGKSQQKISYTDYFTKKEDDLNKNEKTQKEKKTQVETVCETMYGIDDLSKSVSVMKSIQGTEDNKGKFDDIKEQENNIAEFVRSNAETFNYSQTNLKKYLFLYHLNRIHSIPEEIYKNLKSGKRDEVQEANQTIKSFILLYEKHQNKLKIDNLINNQKIIDTANDLMLAIDLDSTFNINVDKDKKRMQQIIDNSINATAFLMNYSYLSNLSNNESYQDPLDIFGVFLLSWKEKINNKIRTNIQNENPLFTSEIEDYLRTKLVLDNINPRRVQFSQKLLPNILPNIDAKKLENELEKRFVRIEQKIICSFYFVHDNYFSGSFFNNIMDSKQALISYPNENFEGIQICSITVIIKLEKFIKQFVSKLDSDYSVIDDIRSADLKEFKTRIIKDVSNILLCYLSNSKLPPSEMLELVLTILFVLFDPYYDEAYKIDQYNPDPLASIYNFCNVCHVLPFIYSAFSNQFIIEIKKGTPDILTKLNKAVLDCFNSKREISSKYENFRSKLRIILNTKKDEEDKEQPFFPTSIIRKIEESLVGIIIQECIDVQDSFPDRDYSKEDKEAIMGFDKFIQELLTIIKDQNINEMALWAKQKIDEIKGLF